MSAFLVIFLVFASCITLMVLLNTIYNRSRYGINQNLSPYLSNDQLSMQELSFLNIYYYDKEFNPQIYRIKGCLTQRDVVTGGYQGHVLKEKCFFIDNIEISLWGKPLLLREEMISYLGHEGEFELITLRDKGLSKTKVIIITFLGKPLLQPWIAEKIASPLYTGQTGIIDSQGTELLEHRTATAQENAVLSSWYSIYSFGTQKDAIILSITIALMIMTSIFIIITDKYLYSFIPLLLLFFFIVYIWSLNPAKNKLFDHVNVIKGCLIWNEKTKHYSIGSLEFDIIYDSFFSGHQELKKDVMVVISGFGPVYIASIAGNPLPLKKNHDLFYAFVALLGMYTVIVGVVLLCKYIL